ncbi:IS3 family transposase [Rothia nasimurium]|uniref:IS3 family transposase n=1 Tax=Rothia nasimurium TaxID=85336 RepID=UPI003C6E0AC6
MIRFINTYKDLFGVEPICQVLSEHLDGDFITASGYYRAIGRVASARSLSDQLLIPELIRIHQENYGVYGVRKMWQALRRAGWSVGRDQTYRLLAGFATPRSSLMRSAGKLWAGAFPRLCILRACR